MFTFFLEFIIILNVVWFTYVKLNRRTDDVIQLFKTRR